MRKLLAITAAIFVTLTAAAAEERNRHLYVIREVLDLHKGDFHRTSAFYNAVVARFGTTTDDATVGTGTRDLAECEERGETCDQIQLERKNDDRYPFTIRLSIASSDPSINVGHVSLETLIVCNATVREEFCWTSAFKAASKLVHDHHLAVHRMTRSLNIGAQRSR